MHCPYCKSQLNIQRAKPGRYGAQCATCGKRLAVLVPEDEKVPMQVAALRSERQPQQASAAPPEPGTAPAEPSYDEETRAEQQPAPPPAAATDEETRAQEDTIPPPAPTTDEETRAQDETMPTPPPIVDEGTRAGEETMPSSTPDAAETVISDAGPPGGAVPPGPPSADPDMPRRLGGYDVVKELGKGGMGAVYLARQVSLDRDVALKVMKREWASNAVFLSRFTREAYAAAHLVHHNVVQIYDIGLDAGRNYFSMEFVPGRTLGEMMKAQGHMDPEVAAGYVLQAARGLEFAHQQGMVHRDIKPDNLMLNEQGVVKVTDLGLVKTPGSESEVGGAAPAGSTRSLTASALGGGVTLAGAAMGTPLYMAPEQSKDAAHVDQRADVYSLGCTLYALVTGRPVFQGKTVAEIMTKHQTEQPAPPETLAARVPKMLSAIISKMMAKDPDDRYPTMGEVVDALEQFLGIDSAGPFTPREEHATLLQKCVNAHNSAPAARRRPKLMTALGGLCVALLVVFALIGWPVAMGGMVALAVLTPLCYFVVSGIAQKGYLFGKVRQLLSSNSLGDWVVLVLGGALALMLLYLFGLLWIWLGFCVGAVALAFAFYMVVDRAVARQRVEALEDVRNMLKSMRLRGLEEEALRQFVCKYSGRNWEPLYETVFGYEAKIEARHRWGIGEGGRLRRKSGAWRDPVIEWIDAKVKARKEAREMKHLAAVEVKARKAEGMSDAQAREEAGKAAEEMVTAAAEMEERADDIAAQRKAEAQARRAIAAKAAAAAGASGQSTLIRRGTIVDTTPKEKKRKPARARKHRTATQRAGGFNILGVLLGVRTRFVIGALLVACCVLWMKQNDLLGARAIAKSAKKVKHAVETGGETVQHSSFVHTDLSDGAGAKGRRRGPKPLSIPFAPKPVRRVLSGYPVGIAGLILLFSALFAGIKMAFFAYPAAVFMMGGPRLLGALFASAPESVQKYKGYASGIVAFGIAIGLMVLGLLLGRRGKTDRQKRRR